VFTHAVHPTCCHSSCQGALLPASVTHLQDLDGSGEGSAQQLERSPCTAEAAVPAPTVELQHVWYLIRRLRHQLAVALNEQSRRELSDVLLRAAQPSCVL
jgi:hypothetical protein